MHRPPFQSVSELLDKWKAGDREALNALVLLIYSELHALAHHYLQGERSGHTLQTTALVNEAYLRLAKQGPFQTQNRHQVLPVLCLEGALLREAQVGQAGS